MQIHPFDILMHNIDALLNSMRTAQNVEMIIAQF